MGRHPILSVLALLVIGGLIVDAAGGPQPTPISATEPSPEAPVVEEPPDVELVNVPRVATRSLAGARSSLVDLGLEVRVVREYSKLARGTILGISPRPATEVELGSTITLTVAVPYPRVPDVVGRVLRNARRTLERVGYDVRIDRQTSSAPTGQVIGMRPGPGTRLLPGRNVTLIVAKAAPQPVTGGGGNCHPSYVGACLDPNAIDYDCAGGSGDGPQYTGFVQVVGYDEFGLDADGDGLGCE